MAQLIRFPRTAAHRPRGSRNKGRYRVSLRIVDAEHAVEARWSQQFAMQRAAGFRCLKDFTNDAARRGRRHVFKIGRASLVRRFLRDVETLVREQRAVIKVDGLRVRSLARRSA